MLRSSTSVFRIRTFASVARFPSFPSERHSEVGRMLSVDRQNLRRRSKVAKATSDGEISLRTATSKSSKSAESLGGPLEMLLDFLKQKIDEAKPHFTNLKPRLYSHKQQFLATMKDRSPVPYQYSFLMETYLWLGVFFVGYEFGQIAGRHVFSSAVRLFCGDFPLFLLTFLLLLSCHLYPLYTKFPVSEQRLHLVALTSLLGCVRGIFFSELFYVGVAPSTFLAPLVIGINTQIIGPTIAENNRKQFLLATIGCAAAVDFLFSFLEGTADVPYLLLLAVDTGILYAHMQYFLKFLSVVWEPWDQMLPWQILAFSATHLSHSFFQYLLSSDSPADDFWW